MMQHKYSPKRNRDILAKQLEKTFNQPLSQVLHQLHFIDELPILHMAKRLNTSRQTTTRLMDDYGVPHRSVAEDTRLRFKKMSFEERKKYTKKANESMCGRKTPMIERVRRAKTMERLAKLSKHEVGFYKFLLEWGFNPIPQYAVAIFNIDFAFPKQKIAIELDGGNWHDTPGHRLGDRRKENYLEKHGWIVLKVRFSKGKWQPTKESFVKSLSELFRERA